MGRPGLTDCDPDRWPLLEGHRDRDGGEGHRSSGPGPGLVEGLSEGCQESSAVYSLGPQLTTGPRLGKLEGLQEKAWICLLLTST